jgi:hypothetical protein
MCAVDPIGPRGTSVVQTTSAVGRCVVRTFRGDPHGHPQKSGSKPSYLCNASRALSGRAAGQSDHERSHDFVTYLDRSCSWGFAL